MKRIAGIIGFILIFAGYVRADSEGLPLVTREIAELLQSSAPVTMAIALEDTWKDDMDLWRTVESASAGYILKELKGYPRFKLIERLRLDKLLEEMHLTYTGVLSGGVIPGNILGVDYLLFISYVQTRSDEGNTGIIIYYKLVQLETGRIISASSHLFEGSVSPVSKKEN